MAPLFKFSPQTQLNLVGIGIIVLLGFGAWILTHPLTRASAIPLALIIYAAWRVIFELTINRKNVPTLAMSFAGRDKVRKILAHEASLRGNRGYKIVDLGSGRGELARSIARAAPTATVLGIEIARIPHWQSVAVTKVFGPKNVSFTCGDFWNFDCSEVDAIVFYLSCNMALRVGEKLYKEMKPGSIVISHTFEIGAPWKPVEILQFHTPFKERIFVYRKG